MKRLRALISETLMEHLYVTSRDISQMSCRETCLLQRLRLDEGSLARSSISPKMIVFIVGTQDLARLFESMHKRLFQVYSLDITFEKAFWEILMSQ